MKNVHSEHQPPRRRWGLPLIGTVLAIAVIGLYAFGNKTGPAFAETTYGTPPAITQAATAPTDIPAGMKVADKDDGTMPTGTHGLRASGTTGLDDAIAKKKATVGETEQMGAAHVDHGAAMPETGQLAAMKADGTYYSEHSGTDGDHLGQTGTAGTADKIGG